MKVPQSIIRYWLAMNASATQSAAHAAKAYIALASGHAIQDSIPALSWQQLCAVFGFAFLIEIFNWLDAHPLAALIPSQALPTTIEHTESAKLS